MAIDFVDSLQWDRVYGIRLPKTMADTTLSHNILNTLLAVVYACTDQFKYIEVIFVDIKGRLTES